MKGSVGQSFLHGNQEINLLALIATVLRDKLHNLVAAPGHCRQHAGKSELSSHLVSWDPAFGNFGACCR